MNGSRQFDDSLAWAPAHGCFVRWVPPLVIAVAVLAVFHPVLWAGFVNWDDDHNIVNNPHIRSLGADELGWMFRETFAGHYQPLTWVSLAIDYRIWGLERPGGFHLTNLVLHLFTAIAVYALATRLIAMDLDPGARRPGRRARLTAMFAALLFALHPLRVESVAWVTERRDVLAGLFFVLSLMAYVKAARSLRDGHPHYWWYLGSIALCALSLLCKAYAVVLVGVLILLDAYPLRRLASHPLRALAGKTPFLLLSAVFGLLAILAQRESGAMYGLEDYDITARAGQALYGSAWYLWKTLYPGSLGPLYELPPRAELVGGMLRLGVGVFVAIGIGCVLLRRRFPFLAVAWVWYLLVLLPVSGICQSGAQLTADRYTYLSCIGWALAAGALLHRALRGSRSPGRAELMAGFCGVLIAAAGVLTWRQCGIWENSTALWLRGTAIAPQSSIAHTNLGSARMHQDPPDPVGAWESYARALELNPDDPKAHNGAATAALAMNDPEVALEHLNEAVRLNPEYAFARMNLGHVLEGYGRYDQAVRQYRSVRSLDPTMTEAARRLGDLLFNLGRYVEAIEAFRSAAEDFPDVAYFHSTLSWLLATCADAAARDGDEALASGTIACELTSWRDPYALDSRAAALAELGRFEEAVAAARQARVLAEEQGRGGLAEQIGRRIALYGAARAYRQGM